MKRAIHRKNSYYDLLGITPRATQADIKQAFYKLSMKFHPDKTTVIKIIVMNVSIMIETNFGFG